MKYDPERTVYVRVWNRGLRVEVEFPVVWMELLQRHGLWDDSSRPVVVQAFEGNVTSKARRVIVDGMTFYVMPGAAYGIGGAPASLQTHMRMSDTPEDLGPEAQAWWYTMV